MLNIGFVGARFAGLDGVSLESITHPSSFEGFGNVFLKAVFYKKPILVNRYSIFVSDIEPIQDSFHGRLPDQHHCEQG